MGVVQHLYALNVRGEESSSNKTLSIPNSADIHDNGRDILK